MPSEANFVIYASWMFYMSYWIIQLEKICSSVLLHLDNWTIVSFCSIFSTLLVMQFSISVCTGSNWQHIFFLLPLASSIWS
jgi:hypothetical protein